MENNENVRTKNVIDEESMVYSYGWEGTYQS